MLFSLLATFATPAHAAPPSPYVRDWSVLQTVLSVCPITWDDLISAHTKSGHAGLDPNGVEYATGWVYAAHVPQVSVTLYEAATDAVIGGATANDLGQVAVWGDVVDLEPVMLARNCQHPVYPRYAVRVETVDTPAGFLDLVF